jgi:hypothetical protein
MGGYPFMDRKNNNNDEIDLIELLGVLIKWRRVLITFVVLLTVLSSIVIILKEHSRYQRAIKTVGSHLNMSKGTGVGSFLYVKKSPLNSIYKFLLIKDSNVTIKAEYETFVSRLLFPVDSEKPVFNTVVSAEDANDISYIFANDNDMYKFRTTYMQTIGLLKKLLSAKEEMSEPQFAQCTYNSTKQNEQKDRACFNYLYIQNVLMDRISYAAGALINMNMVFLDVISTAQSKFNEDSVKIVKKELSAPDKNKILAAAVKEETGHGLDRSKIIKYVFIVFILSVFMGVFLAFILEFWVKNRGRISEYLK